MHFFADDVIYEQSLTFTYLFLMFQNIEKIKNHQKESKYIKLGNRLGSGEFGQVYEGKNYQSARTNKHKSKIVLKEKFILESEISRK